MERHRTSIARWLPLVAGIGLSAVAGFSGAAPAAAADPADDSVRLEVDLSERMLYVYRDGNVARSYQVAIGEPDHPTPKGDFTIDRVIWNPAWVPPPNAEWAEGKEKKWPGDPDNPMQGAKLFFEYPDYYIHGTNATHTLGQAESHGCIRMDPADVKDLAEFVQKQGGEERSRAWFASARRDDNDKHKVTLPDPVPVSIYQ